MADTNPAAWTTASLYRALTAPDYAEDLDVSRIDGAQPVLAVRMKQYGDLPILITAGEEQIVVATLLWPVDEQDNAREFNSFLLRAQRLIPLSNFAITVVDGREYYELMGELSAESRLVTIVQELTVLAENAMAAAGELREAFAAR